MNNATKLGKNSNINIQAQIRKFLSNYMIWVILAMLLAYCSLTIDGFTNPVNLVNILFHSSFLGVLTIGETLCLLTGRMDLSIESTLAFAAMVAAWLMGTGPYTSMLGLSPIIAFVVLLLIGVLVGITNAFFIVTLKVSALIVTLAMQVVLRGLTVNLTNSNVLSDLPNIYTWLGQNSLWGIPLLVFVFLILYWIFNFILNNTKFGRRIYAIGDNEEAAYASGINVNRTLYLAFILSSVFAAFTGFMMTSRIGAVPATLGDGYAFDVFAAAVIGGVSLQGGKGNLLGALAGVLLLGSITNALNLANVSPYHISIIRGLIILFAVVIDTIKNRFLD